MDTKKIVELVGGKANIISVSHCMTRLRFVLGNTELAQIKELEALPGIKGTFTQAGQFQVVIGNNVAEVYKAMLDENGLVGQTKSEVKQIASQRMSVLQQITTYLSEIFAPIIPAIIVGGLILGFRNILELPINGNVLVKTSQFWSGIHSFLWLLGEAIFAFLPVHICWSAYRKAGGTEVLGIVLGITLVSPQLLNAYAVASTAAASIPAWDFGFFKIQMIGYQAQVVPALLVGLFGGILEIRLAKVIPSYIQIIIIPFTVLLITSLMAHVVLGPLGWFIGSQISNLFMWLFNTLGFLGGMIFGFIYAPLVITGLHHTTNAIDLQLIAETGSTRLWPLIAISNIAQGSAVLAMVIMQKKAEKRELSVPATISAYLGVTEPAMFGVNLKYGFPFLCAMTGSALAAGVSTFLNVEASSIGVGGLPGILSIKPGGYLNFLVAMLIAIVVPALLTIIVFKKNADKNGLLLYDKK